MLQYAVSIRTGGRSMERRRIKREKIVGVHADQIRWPHDQCRRSPLRRSSGCGPAPAAGCRDWRQPPAGHREKQARRCRRCRLPQRCCGPWLTETCGVHRRRATGEPCRPSGSHSRRPRAVSIQGRGVGRAFLPARGSADRVGQFLRGILVRFLTGAPSPFV